MKSGLILFLFFSFSFAQAQSIRCHTSLLAFDTLLETQTDSLSFFLSNVSQQGITVNQFYLMPIYGAPAFFLKDSVFLVPAMDSVRVWVYFKPRHNIYHNSELIMAFCPTGQCLAGTHRINLTGQGRYSNTYYQTTENLVEQSLRTALKTKISSPFTSLGYNSARDQMFMLIDNKATNGQGAAVNTLECIYTGRVITGYTSRTQAQNSPMNFNTEHTFPQGFFNENEPMRSDLFHLFPTDAPANNSRANFAFGIASTPFQNVAINNPLNLADASKLGSNNLYEPRNLQKGRTARGMMYFVLRYQDYSNFMSGQESILRSWHSLYPPLTEERTRNQAIALQQQNRNPFIDYPQFAERISSLTATNTSAPVVWGIRPALNSIHLGQVGADSLYRYVFYLTNTGNQAIQISNTSISGAGLAITSGSSGFTIAVGESTPVSFSFTQSGNLIPSGTLSFQTNVPGFGSVNIPITGANQLSLEQTEFRFVAPELFPLPADEAVYISFKEKLDQPLFIRLINEQGQVVFNQIESPNSESIMIETRHLPEGFYFLGLAYGSFHQFYKVPVRH